MGVTYKLKPDVVEFIIARKKENPRLSCRSMVDIIAQTFQIHVSKSSINNVFKQADLSSPVGRRPKSVQPAHFKIPEHKKKELFEAHAKLLEQMTGNQAGPPETSHPVPPEDETQPRPEQDESRPGAVRTEEAEPADKTDEMEQEQADIEERAMRPGQPSIEQPKEAPAKEERLAGGADIERSKVEVTAEPAGGIQYKGMGAAILKACMLDISPQPLMPQILKNFPHMNEQDCLALETAILLPDLQESTIARLDQEAYKGLWLINGIGQPLGSSAVIEAMNKLEELKGFDLEFRLEWKSLTTEVDRIRLHMDQGDVWEMDGRLKSLIGNERQAHPVPAATIGCAINHVKQILINQEAPFIARLDVNKEEERQRLKRFWAAFGRSDQRISRVELLSPGGDVMSAYSHLSTEPGPFICVARPGPEWYKDGDSGFKLLEQNDFNIEYAVRGELASQWDTTGARSVVVRSGHNRQEIRILFHNLERDQDALRLCVHTARDSFLNAGRAETVQPSSDHVDEGNPEIRGTSAEIVCQTIRKYIFNKYLGYFNAERVTTMLDRAGQWHQNDASINLYEPDITLQYIISYINTHNIKFLDRSS